MTQPTGSRIRAAGMRGLLWAARKLAFLATLVAAAVAVLLLPTLITRGTSGFGTDIARYWSAVSFHLLHLVKGQLIPPLANGVRDYLQSVPMELAEGLPVTLKLLGTAFVASLLLGLALGVLLSVLAPRWLRAVIWGATTMLYSLPDMLISSILYLALILVAMIRGGAGPLRGPESWHHFWAPAVAVTLTVLPYIARVTATAIDEITGEPYIRAAVARGIHPAWILLKHVGKHVLIRVTTILPVVASLLFSSGAVVEYMSEVHGVGRLLIINAGPRAVDRYAGAAFLIPLLVLFTVILGLSELLQRLLDPRITPAGAGAAAALPAASAIRPGRPTLAGLISGLATVGKWLRSTPAALRAGVLSRPRRLRQAMRDPVLLFGALLVLVLVAVAVAAPWLAPYDPAQRIAFINAPGGGYLVPPLAPSPQHWFGTDDYGRDVLSRILFGTRYALIFALLAVPARFLLAVPFGLLAAFRGGFWAKLIRWLATYCTAVPQVLLPLALIPSVNLLFMERSGLALFWAVALIALPGAPRLASSVQQQAATVLAQPFVEGAHAVGAGTARTLFRYVLPQMGPQLATMLALEIPAVLTLTAVLGYFGAYPGGAIFDTQTYRPLGPLLPEWGSIMESPLMILLAGRWWLWAPFGALFVAVLAFNLLGEGMRRALVSRTGWKWPE